LSGSVPSVSEAQATFTATLFDEWVQLGLRDVVLSPGSRSTPLALAAAAREDLTVHVRLDERSAGFFALGRAMMSERPVAVVVTSGTAAAELHACVAEADLAFVPLLILTADRPPELHGVGAPQVIEQGHLYGPMVRAFEEPGVARPEMAVAWRPLAARLWRAAIGESAAAGPVHLNAAFIEPLIADPYELPARQENVAGRAPTEELPYITSLNVKDHSVLCVVGRGVSAEVIKECRGLNWVVLGDATAQGSLAHYDVLLRSPSFVQRVRPELVVRLGGLPASKVLSEQLRAWSARTVSRNGAGFVADPAHLISEAYCGLPHHTDAPLSGSRDYAQRWIAASETIEQWLMTQDAATSALNEPLVARTVVALSTARDVPLVVGSSMPVRDVEWWAPARASATFANRGVNGIDGVVSTVFGVAAGGSSLGLVGDLTMLHDVSALVDGVGTAGGTAVLVVVDNRGGGIFSFLPQATLLDGDRFEQLFGTPRHHNLETVASAFGHQATTVATLEELTSAIEKGLASDGVKVVIAQVPSREENVQLHEAWNEHAASLLDA
jgi:2-succinyl-5-enolpyruvyl-6-hydroxy-3-cyclohexene-1-carboxylate synthase